MPAQIVKWQPISDIDSTFGSISYSFQQDTLQVRLIGTRTLLLYFSGVIALRFEQECPGVDFPPLPLPMLGPSQTFPLLLVEGSEWLEQFDKIYRDISHFALVSSDHLLQLLAKSSVNAQWEK